MKRYTRVLRRQALAVAAVAVLLAGGGTAVAAGRVAKGSGAKLDAPTLARLIDQEIQAKLTAEKVTAAPLADDAEFLRRLYLDIAGVIPPADKVVEFLNDTSPDKRARVIDELLASPQYGRHLADIWQAMLLPRTSDNRRLQHEPMIKWLEQNFNENKPWNQMVSELLTATGTQDKNGAVTFFLANPTADKVNDIVSRLFLGIQLQCAQCHNHPFTSWKQTDYWGMANFFVKVRPDNVNRAAKQGVSPGINESGTGRQRMLPESAMNLPPKFLLGEQPKLKANEPYRPAFAAWLTSPDNPFFARAMVNRMWHHFFGRGLVNPVDDMHEGNIPSHPELLQELTAQFVASGFDLKHLIRGICNSQTYQRSSKPVAGDVDPALFAHMTVKVLTPEQLYDSLEQVLGPARPARPVLRNANPALQRANNPRNQFVAFFQGDENADPTEYQDGIPQALRLMNAPQANNLTAAVNRIAKGEQAPAAVIERLYLATLSRRPSTAEAERLTAYVQKQGDARQAYHDILWALINSSEFRLNH
ncbi:MAG TPA: DUF1549 and DUF1553 domain-containing protein [Gemmataceae bacterium]|nr:DUF1549 and DUF1553 domain-containing protein [Gemmataceae bacterium]